jgi:hypothetical protein
VKPVLHPLDRRWVRFCIGVIVLFPGYLAIDRLLIDQGGQVRVFAKTLYYAISLLPQLLYWSKRDEARKAQQGEELKPQ